MNAFVCFISFYLQQRTGRHITFQSFFSDVINLSGRNIFQQNNKNSSNKSENDKNAGQPAAMFIRFGDHTVGNITRIAPPANACIKAIAKGDPLLNNP